MAKYKVSIYENPYEYEITASSPQEAGSKAMNIFNGSIYKDIYKVKVLPADKDEGEEDKLVTFSCN